MKSLGLIQKLNEDPSLRMPTGITAGKLAARIQTLIELGKLDRDAQVFFEDAAITSAIAEDDGESFVLSDVDDPKCEACDKAGSHRTTDDVHLCRACYEGAKVPKS